MSGEAKWHPWVGKNYEATRLLLLGESAYSWREEDGTLQHPSPNYAIEAVESVLRDFDDTRGFIRTLSRALANEEWPGADELRRVWHRVAFTNYVPGTVGEGPRLEPTAEMWESSKQAFPELLNKLEPRRVIILGKRTWSHMPVCDVWITDDVQAYRLASGSLAMCWALKHPSWGLSWRELSAFVQFACERELAG